MSHVRNRWSIEQSILERALGDRAELRRLEANPRKCLEQALGEPLSPDIAVRVAFDTPSTLHQVVPFVGHTMLGELDPPAGDAAIGGMRGISIGAAHRAVHDPQFRERLLAEPAAFAREGLHRLSLSADLEVVVLVEDASTVWLHIPLVGRKAVRGEGPGSPA
jgi:hypothetical protein